MNIKFNTSVYYEPNIYKTLNDINNKSTIIHFHNNFSEFMIDGINLISYLLFNDNIKSHIIMIHNGYITKDKHEFNEILDLNFKLNFKNAENIIKYKITMKYVFQVFINNKNILLQTNNIQTIRGINSALNYFHSKNNSLYINTFYKINYKKFLTKLNINNYKIKLNIIVLNDGLIKLDILDSDIIIFHKDDIIDNNFPKYKNGKSKLCDNSIRLNNYSFL